MFFVVNKEKIKTYLISVGTVFLLLITSIALRNNVLNSTVETSNSIIKMPICKIKMEEKKLALSINCTQNMDNISNILDTLSKMRVTASFFVTGDVIDKYPEEVKKIISNNNEVGNMCNHYTSLKAKSKNEIRNEIVECSRKIENLTGKTTNLLRIPYGEYNNSILEVAESEKMNTIAWNIDPLDYNDLTTEEMWEIIEENLIPGSIILLHNEYIGESLETLIHNIQEKGYTITNVSNIIYKDNYQINDKGEQYVLN